MIAAITYKPVWLTEGQGASCPKQLSTELLSCFPRCVSAADSSKCILLQQNQRRSKTYIGFLIERHLLDFARDFFLLEPTQEIHHKNADENISNEITFFTVSTCFREQLRAMIQISSVLPRNGKVC